MKAVIQVCKESSVEIDDKIYSAIKTGLNILVGFTNGDNEVIIDKMINKIINLRIFKDEQGLTNLNLNDINGSILSISQFTLYADTSNGRRPSFTAALNPEEASKLYDLFNRKLKDLKINVKTGIFGAYMKVNIINDGPFTIILDSKEFK